MNGVWTKIFKVSLKVVKEVVAEPGSDLSDFVPQSLYFENHIFAQMIATTLIARKESLSNISSRDIFVLYCLLKKSGLTGPHEFTNICWKIPRI